MFEDSSLHVLNVIIGDLNRELVKSSGQYEAESLSAHPDLLRGLSRAGAARTKGSDALVILLWFICADPSIL